MNRYDSRRFRYLISLYINCEKNLLQAIAVNSLLSYLHSAVCSVEVAVIILVDAANDVSWELAIFKVVERTEFVEDQT